jgi:hypothetical protein
MKLSKVVWQLLYTKKALLTFRRRLFIMGKGETENLIKAP